MGDSSALPFIFDIKRFALDDGPGIRTTVFFKGCPLSCAWCQNPESIIRTRELAFYQNRCIQCGDCRMVCPEHAVNPFDSIVVNREKCKACGECAGQCPARALMIVGEYFTVSRLVEVLTRDRSYYDASEGGITLSGGEPTLHMDYVRDVVREIKNNDLNIVLQTSGLFDLDEFNSKLLQYIDLVHYDLKILDTNMHKKYTGVGNEQILYNFGELVKNTDVNILPRVPLIPGITDTADNLNQIADYLKGLGVEKYVKLEYNSSGDHKRDRIGMKTNRSDNSDQVGL